VEDLVIKLRGLCCIALATTVQAATDWEEEENAYETKSTKGT